MVARIKGGGQTPERIVELLRAEVERTSQAATARATGLTLRGVQNYIKGIGEPTTATLQKLANYFGVTVSWLRGDPGAVTVICDRCGGVLDTREESGSPQVLRAVPCPVCCKTDSGG